MSTSKMKREQASSFPAPTIGGGITAHHRNTGQQGILLLAATMMMLLAPSSSCHAFSFSTLSSSSGSSSSRTTTAIMKKQLAHHSSSTSLSFHTTNGKNKFSINNNHHDSNHVVFKYRRISSSTSSTALQLNIFGMNDNNENNDENESKDKKKNNNVLSKNKKTKNDNEKENETNPNNNNAANYQNLVTNYVRPSLSFLKIAFPSFLAGTIATLSVLFLPLLTDYYDAFTGNPNTYSSANNNNKNNDNNGGKNNNNNSNKGGSNANNLNQPVILFETILSDLNEAYVDDVDIQQLFETGVKAMTASLDPYTEFESRLEAQAMEESVSGRYGGVGLVIRGGINLGSEEEDISEDTVVTTNGKEGEKQAQPSSSSLQQQPPVAVKDGINRKKMDNKSMNKEAKVADDEDEDDDAAQLKRMRRKTMEEGVRVVTAFEGYAYDAGFRVGDKLIAIDDFPILPTISVDEVRDHLRGEPGTDVSITFIREGLVGKGSTTGKNEPQTITMKRQVVRIPDVKYFGFVGDPKDGIGYVDLSGFANDAGREVRFAIRALQHGAEMAARSDNGNGDGSGSSLENVDPTQLKGLILDLRSNPGGLLTSAVDVATLFVPNGSDIVSAKGRGFPESLYRSKTEPVLNPNTRLAVLVNEQTASAAEIVTGAVQDLDVGIVVGKGRTFGKGLVQNVQELPYQTALKYTVAKYYTPSGRCIQSTDYDGGGRGGDILASDTGNGKPRYKSTKVADKDRKVFYTAGGREVKDGGGVEVDYKVEPQKASPLEIILQNSGAYSSFAADWSKHHELTNDFKLDDATYREFQKFVEKRQKDGDTKLEVLYDVQLKELQKKLKATGLDSSNSRRELDKLRADIIKDVKKDFTTYKKEIMEDLEQNILARYLPDSMLIERGLRADVQVDETAKMLKDGKEFDKILGRDKAPTEMNNDQKFRYETATVKEEPMLQTRW